VTEILAESGLRLPNYANADDLVANDAFDPATAQIRVQHLRDEAIRDGQSFTYETVMSHPSHLAAMERAVRRGHFVRLIFVTTDDPEINVLRVAHRVKLGGHDVPAEKIRQRYRTVMQDRLVAAIQIVDETFVFDNSFAGRDPRRVAHVVQKYVYAWNNPDLTWPGPCLFDKLAATGDYLINWR
jgi:predicted ABC-type ATPase